MNTALRNVAATAATAIALTGAAKAASVIDIAAGDDRFSTLVTAIEAAGLAEALSGSGPFTVYAPLNDAFAAVRRH